MTLESKQKVKREREGAGSRKVLEPGFKLGTPVTQQHYTSAHLPTRLSAPTNTQNYIELL